MGRIALVTGGTRGIGAAIAVALRDAGYQAVATYAANEARAAQFREETGIPVYRWDVADFAACQAGVAAAVKDFGPVEILVNNAGITKDVMLHKMSPEQWQAVLGTNLTSCFNMCRAVIESMRSRNFGRIINITSINGQCGQMGQTNYSASKAGMIGFTKALALETASKGITVNAIAPGYIDTEMVQAVSPEVLAKIVAKIPVGRLGRAAEVAQAAVYLAGDGAGFITGSTLTINGGQYLD